MEFIKSLSEITGLIPSLAAILGAIIGFVAVKNGPTTAKNLYKLELRKHIFELIKQGALKNDVIKQELYIALDKYYEYHFPEVIVTEICKMSPDQRDSAFINYKLAGKWVNSREKTQDLPSIKGYSKVALGCLFFRFILEILLGLGLAGLCMGVILITYDNPKLNFLIEFGIVALSAVFVVGGLMLVIVRAREILDFSSNIIKFQEQMGEKIPVFGPRRNDIIATTLFWIIVLGSWVSYFW